jgi:hypothetical protein
MRPNCYFMIGNSYILQGFLRAGASVKKLRLTLSNASAQNQEAIPLRTPSASIDTPPSFGAPNDEIRMDSLMLPTFPASNSAQLGYSLINKSGTLSGVSFYITFKATTGGS